jgi:cysteine synthase
LLSFSEDFVAIVIADILKACFNQLAYFLIGLSAGAVVQAFNKISKDEGVYVLIFPDTGYKYAEQFENYFQKSGGR